MQIIEFAIIILFKWIDDSFQRQFLVNGAGLEKEFHVKTKAFKI